MLTLCAWLVVTGTPFSARDLRAGRTEPGESTAAFVARHLSVRGAVHVSQVERPFRPTRVEWRVSFDGVATIEGVACEGMAFASHVLGDDGSPVREGFWGCRLAPPTADALKLPRGVIASFSRADGVLEHLLVPRKRLVSVGQLPCAGELQFQGETLSRCELARPRRINDVELPAGAVLSFTTHDRLVSASISGRTVVAAGRTWGPEFTMCGALDLRFDADGGLHPPEPDPHHEACCD